MPVLFVIALVLSVLKLLGYVAMSWFWIAFVWPIMPTLAALSIIAVGVWAVSR